MSLHGARRELKRLRDKLRADEKDFRAAAPPVDEHGLPDWDGATPLSVEGYMAALGFAPDEELTPPELAARHRLSPYIEVFERLDRAKAEKEAAVK